MEIFYLWLKQEYKEENHKSKLNIWHCQNIIVSCFRGPKIKIARFVFFSTESAVVLFLLERKFQNICFFFLGQHDFHTFFFLPDFLYVLVTETVFMKNARPGVSRAFCIWYKALGPLLIRRMTWCFLVDPIRGVNQRLCRRAVWILGIFENPSWISNQDYWLLWILQPVLLHPNQNRRAAPQWCSRPWSSTGCYCGHSLA